MATVKELHMFRPSLLLIALCLSSCAPMANGEMAMLIPTSLFEKSPDTKEYYPEMSRQLADSLDAQLAMRLGFNNTTTRGLQWLVVTTPANVNQMGEATTLSRAVSEQLATAMTAKGYYVQEIRKTSEVIFDKNQGEFMLSRDARELATRKFQSTLVMTGTYVAMPAGVRFNIEILDARNNDVVAKASSVIPMSQTVAYLHESGQGGQGGGNIRPTVATVPGAPENKPSVLPPGDWRTSRQKYPSFLLP